MERQHVKRYHQSFSRQNSGSFDGHYYYDASHNPVGGSGVSNQENDSPHPFSGVSQPSISPYEMYAKPQQPEEWGGPMGEGYFQPPEKKPNPIMAHFYDENGQMDLQKMLSTVNQLANTFQQVTPVIQQIGSFVRLIR